MGIRAPQSREMQDFAINRILTLRTYSEITRSKDCSTEITSSLDMMIMDQCRRQRGIYGGTKCR